MQNDLDIVTSSDEDCPENGGRKTERWRIRSNCCPWGLVPGGAAGRSVELISGAFAREGFSPPQIDFYVLLIPRDCRYKA